MRIFLSIFAAINIILSMLARFQKEFVDAQYLLTMACLLGIVLLLRGEK
jgi:hypothetical protein